MEVSSIAMYAGSTCFTAAILLAGIMDIATLKIRNELVLFLIAIYAALAPLIGTDLVTIGWSAGVALIVLVASFILFSAGWIGGGDAKLASAVALWVGSDYAVDFLIYTALFGGVLALSILQLRVIRIPAHWLHRKWLTRLCQPQSGIPYGAAIAAGAFAVLPSTPWFAGIP